MKYKKGKNMDTRDKLREEIRKEVISDLLFVYSDALEKLKVKERIVAEKERICDELFGDYFNALAANRAVKRAKREMSGTDTIN